MKLRSDIISTTGTHIKSKIPSNHQPKSEVNSEEKINDRIFWSIYKKDKITLEKQKQKETCPIVERNDLYKKTETIWNKSSVRGEKCIKSRCNQGKAIWIGYFPDHTWSLFKRHSRLNVRTNTFRRQLEFAPIKYNGDTLNGHC